MEADALFLRVLVLFLAGGDLLLAAAVHDRHVRAQTLGAARGVHGDVARADDGRHVDGHERGVVALVVSVHEVDAGEELVGGEHAAVAQTGDVLELRQAGARADEHGLVLVVAEEVVGVLAEQLVDAHALADGRVAHDVDAHGHELVDLLLHDGLRQTELGDAVSQHAAGLVEVLIDGHVVAELGQVARAGEAGRAGADDGDAVAVRGDLLGHLVGVLAVPVGDEALQTADADGLALDAAHALALALLLLRADAAADGGQGAVLEDLVVSALEVLLTDAGDELRDLDIDRAALHAGRARAIQAAVGLIDRHLDGVAKRDFFKILIADVRVLLRDRILFGRHIRHDYFSSFFCAASSASAMACRLQ